MLLNGAEINQSPSRFWMCRAGIVDAEAEKLALASETIQKFLDGKKPKKVVVVAGKLVNIVV